MDRIDKDGKYRYQVWDYKTGSTWGYGDSVFSQGRHIQSGLYLLMLQTILKEREPGAEVVRAGYFFPSNKGRGQRIDWGAKELEPAQNILRQICDGIANGAFILSDDGGDVKYTDYSDAFCSWLCQNTEWSKEKLANIENAPLLPMALLREYVTEETNE